MALPGRRAAGGARHDDALIADDETGRTCDSCGGGLLYKDRSTVALPDGNAPITRSRAGATETGGPA